MSQQPSRPAGRTLAADYEAETKDSLSQTDLLTPRSSHASHNSESHNSQATRAAPRGTHTLSPSLGDPLAGLGSLGSFGDDGRDDDAPVTVTTTFDAALQRPVSVTTPSPVKSRRQRQRSAKSRVTSSNKKSSGRRRRERDQHRHSEPQPSKVHATPLFQTRLRFPSEVPDGVAPLVLGGVPSPADTKQTPRSKKQAPSSDRSGRRQKTSTGRRDTDKTRNADEDGETGQPPIPHESPQKEVQVPASHLDLLTAGVDIDTHDFQDNDSAVFAGIFGSGDELGLGLGLGDVAEDAESHRRREHHGKREGETEPEEEQDEEGSDAHANLLALFDRTSQRTPRTPQTQRSQRTERTDRTERSDGTERLIASVEELPPSKRRGAGSAYASDAVSRALDNCVPSSLTPSSAPRGGSGAALFDSGTDRSLRPSPTRRGRRDRLAAPDSADKVNQELQKQLYLANSRLKMYKERLGQDDEEEEGVDSSVHRDETDLLHLMSDFGAAPTRREVLLTSPEDLAALEAKAKAQRKGTHTHSPPDSKLHECDESMLDLGVRLTTERSVRSFASRSSPSLNSPDKENVFLDHRDVDIAMLPTLVEIVNASYVHLHDMARLSATSQHSCSCRHHSQWKEQTRVLTTRLRQTRDFMRQVRRNSVKKQSVLTRAKAHCVRDEDRDETCRCKRSRGGNRKDRFARRLFDSPSLISPSHSEPESRHNVSRMMETVQGFIGTLQKDGERKDEHIRRLQGELNQLRVTYSSHLKEQNDELRRVSLAGSADKPRTALRNNQ